jgi:hypothetical protein
MMIVEVTVIQAAMMGLHELRFGRPARFLITEPLVLLLFRVFWLDYPSRVVVMYLVERRWPQRHLAHLMAANLSAFLAWAVLLYLVRPGLRGEFTFKTDAYYQNIPYLAAAACLISPVVVWLLDRASSGLRRSKP